MRLQPSVMFRLTWDALGGPTLQEEYRFHPARRFRFDFAHLPSMTAIEIEGGTWSRGRHVRPQGYRNDVEKYNLAALGGWTVLRLTTDMVTDEHIRPIMERCRRGEYEQST